MGRMIVSPQDVERLQGLLQSSLQAVSSPRAGPPAVASPGPASPTAAGGALPESYLAKILPYLKQLLDTPPPVSNSSAAGANLPPVPVPIKPIEADNYLSRLIKYIPTEIIAVYLTLHSVILSDKLGEIPVYICWAIVAFGVLCTYLYLLRVQKVTKQMQLIISCGAFLVWALTLGGPGFEWFQPIYGALLLPSYTLLVGILDH